MSVLEGSSERFKTLHFPDGLIAHNNFSFEDLKIYLSLIEKTTPEERGISQFRPGFAIAGWRICRQPRALLCGGAQIDNVPVLEKIVPTQKGIFNKITRRTLYEGKVAAMFVPLQEGGIKFGANSLSPFPESKSERKGTVPSKENKKKSAADATFS